MTTLAQLSLGWPFPSGLPQSTDWEFLRRAFGDLAKTLSWPFVHVSHTGPTALALNPIPLTVVNRFDSSSLMRPATDRIYCPQDFNQYLAVGAAGAEFTTTGAGTTTLSWRVNGAVTVWGQRIHYSIAETPRLTTIIVKPLNKGQYLTLSSSGPVGAELELLEASVYFIPLR